MSEKDASSDFGLPVILIKGILSVLLMEVKRLFRVFPEYDNARTASFWVIMPKSPWLASPG